MVQLDKELSKQAHLLKYLFEKDMDDKVTLSEYLQYVLVSGIQAEIDFIFCTEAKKKELKIWIESLTPAGNAVEQAERRRQIYNIKRLQNRVRMKDAIDTNQHFLAGLIKDGDLEALEKENQALMEDVARGVIQREKKVE